MLDDVPVQVWLLVAIAAAGYAPARYVVEHLAHSPANRDITLPPEDLGWRTSTRLALNLAVLAGLLALTVFIFTYEALRFARSAIFVPALLAAFGAVALSTVVRSSATGRISPLIQGIYSTFEREEQPKRYWASVAWNGMLGCLMLGLAPAAYRRPTEDACENYNDSHSSQQQLAACNELLAEGASGDRLAELLADRGIAYHGLADYNRALSDYSRAIELNPEDSYSLYNRALVHQQLGELAFAVQDFDASLRTRPNNEEAYLNRGLIFLDIGAFDKASADFTRAHELDPEDHWNLANRGISYAWMNDPARAEADFAAVEAVDPANFVVLRGRAVLAANTGDRHKAIRHLTDALEHDPSDAWSLKMRADIYWKMGLHDKARDDDEQLDLLLEKRESAERSP